MSRDGKNPMVACRNGVSVWTIAKLCERLQHDVRILGGQARARRCLNFLNDSIRKFQIHENLVSHDDAFCSTGIHWVLHMQRDHSASDRQLPPKIIWKKLSVLPPTNRSGF